MTLPTPPACSIRNVICTQIQTTKGKLNGKPNLAHFQFSSFALPPLGSASSLNSKVQLILFMLNRPFIFNSERFISGLGRMTRQHSSCSIQQCKSIFALYHRFLRRDQSFFLFFKCILDPDLILRWKVSPRFHCLVRMLAWV